MNSDDSPDSPSSSSPDPPSELRGLDPANLFAEGLRTTRPAVQTKGWTPPSPEELAELLPQFRIEGLLGRGGMGAVYKGVQPALDRPVAIKLLPTEFAEDADFVTRFQREARTLASLRHPGIVGIYGFGETEGGHFYFVMEFVDGTDLSQIIRGGALETAQALELTVQICEALRYAHDQGVIHRDIKPANILVTRDGRARLADFGLARPLLEEQGALTVSGTVMGTPAYMAPEQREGNVDHRADIYALGVLLYEMLTGIQPEGIFTPPSAKMMVDVRLDEVVIKAMQEAPERRYQQAGEMKTEVDRIRSTPVPRVQPAIVKPLKPSVARPQRSSNPVRKAGQGARTNLWITALAVVLPILAIGAFLGWILMRQSPSTASHAAMSRDAAESDPASAVSGKPAAISNEPSADAKPLPRVFGPTVPRTTSMPYPWKTDIITKLFWVGGPALTGESPRRSGSAWDTAWEIHFGGEDDPRHRADDFRPANFVPQLNPFYVALPYNDCTYNTGTKTIAAKVIPWFKQMFKKPGESVCWNHWVAVRHGDRVCFAQWSDCGPLSTDDANYVFGDARPANTQYDGEGLNVSPAVRDYLGFESGEPCDWRFVDISEVPDGPWKKYGSNNPFVQAAGQEKELVVARLEELRKQRDEWFKKNGNASLSQSPSASPSLQNELPKTSPAPSTSNQDKPAPPPEHPGSAIPSPRETVVIKDPKPETWIDAKNRPIGASLVKVNGDEITLLMDTGRLYAIPLNQLSPESQKRVEELKAANAGPANPVKPAQPMTYPYAKPVPAKPGFVYSPYGENLGMIDVQSLAPGTKVQDPYTHKIFLVPETKPEAASKLPESGGPAAPAPNAKPFPKPDDHSSTETSGFETVRHEGRDYVTVESLGRFYRLDSHEIDGGNVHLKSSVLSINARVGSQELLINGIKFLLSYPVVESSGKALFSRTDLVKVLDPVLRPAYINGPAFDTVVVDAAHGGEDAGARGIYGYEKDFTLQLAASLKSDLEKRGLKVVLTREGDTLVPPEVRLATANKIPNSILISLQFNRGPADQNGIETLALAPASSPSAGDDKVKDDATSSRGNRNDSVNIALAAAIHASVMQHFKLSDRGVKRTNTGLLAGLESPGVVFVGGFLTNETDAVRISHASFLQELAKSMGDAIMNYRRALNLTAPRPPG